MSLLSVQWINSCWWTDELPKTCRVSRQNKFVILVDLVGLITKKFVTMHGHTIVKFRDFCTCRWQLVCSVLNLNICFVTNLMKMINMFKHVELAKMATEFVATKATFVWGTTVWRRPYCSMWRHSCWRISLQFLFVKRPFVSLPGLLWVKTLI